MVFNIDYEGLFSKGEIDLRFLLAWRHADVMHVITKLGYDIFSSIRKFYDDKTFIPVHYGHFGRPHAGGIHAPSPTPLYKRHGVVFTRHTNMPEILTELEVIKKSRMKAIGIDSIPPPFSFGEYLRYMADAFKVKGNFYPRLPFTQYLQVLSKAYVGICNHVGVSRFTWECMRCGIPVIHSEYSEWGNILYPSLTVGHNDTQAFINKIKVMRKVTKQYKHVYENPIKLAQMRARTEYSLKVCELRVDEFLKRLLE
jgi:hypothetical protein